MSIFIIQQKISAGDNFNKTAPVTTPTYSKDLKRYPVGATGGLFDFEQNSPHEIRSIELILGGQSAWSISKVDSEGDELVIFSGTTETKFIKTGRDIALLYDSENISISTTGATGALKCRIAIGRV